MQLEKLEDKAQPAAALLKAMGNRHRLLILCHLACRELCVGELEALIGLSQSALSQHLARLRRDALVVTRRKAQTIYYSLSGGDAKAIIDTLYRLFCGGQGRGATERAGSSKGVALGSR